MPPKDDGDINALHLISDILDKIIDTQQANTETNVALRKSVEEISRTVEKMNEHFSNGFRSELKKHTEDTIAKYSVSHDEIYGGKEYVETLKEIRASVNDIKNTQHNWWFWIKHVGLIIAGFGGVIAAIVKVIQWLSLTI